MAIFLKRYQVKDKQLVQEIIEAAPQYSLYVDGILPLADGAQRLLKAIPPNTDYNDKHVLIIYLDDIAIGICDLINGYPQKEIGFIGLLLLREDMQAKGMGRASYVAIEAYAKKLGLKKIELTIVDCNPVELFWTKMGFSPNGREKLHEGEKVQSIARVYEKLL